MSNIFDETELNKKLQEAEAAFGEVKEEIKPEELEEEIPAAESKEDEVVDDLEEEVKEEAEEEERPGDKEGDKWKKLRAEKKAAKKLAEEQKASAEKAAKENMELRERLARLEGREEARAKPEVKEPENTDPEPDADLDPDLHIKWQLRQTNNRIAAAEKRAAMAEELAKVEGTRRGLQMLEKDYIKTNKLDDYDDAIQHIKNVNKNLIKLDFPTATDAQIEAHLEAERIKKASDSYEKGINPAEYFYKMAVGLGYQKAKANKVDNKPNIDALNRNMGKNANLIGASNVENTGGVPTDKVVKMSIDQLLKQEGSAALEAAIKREEAKWMRE